MKQFSSVLVLRFATFISRNGLRWFGDQHMKKDSEVDHDSLGSTDYKIATESTSNINNIFIITSAGNRKE